MSLGPNLVTNPTMIGGSSPGTLPTSWFLNSHNIGTVTTAYAYGTETGIAYIDFILNGTPAAGGTFQVVYGVNFTGSPLNVISSRLYSTAANIKLQAGAWTNAIPQLSFQENNGGFIRNDQFYVGQSTSGTLDLNRYSGAIRTAANCKLLYGVFFLNFAAASPIGLTVRFGNPTIQLDDDMQFGGAQRLAGWWQG